MLFVRNKSKGIISLVLILILLGCRNDFNEKNSFSLITDAIAIKYPKDLRLIEIDHFKTVFPKWNNESKTLYIIGDFQDSTFVFINTIPEINDKQTLRQSFVKIKANSLVLNIESKFKTIRKSLSGDKYVFEHYSESEIKPFYNLTLLELSDSILYSVTYSSFSKRNKVEKSIAKQILDSFKIK